MGRMDVDCLCFREVDQKGSLEVCVQRLDAKMAQHDVPGF